MNTSLKRLFAMNGMILVSCIFASSAYSDAPQGGIKSKTPRPTFAVYTGILDGYPGNNVPFQRYLVESRIEAVKCNDLDGDGAATGADATWGQEWLYGWDRWYEGWDIDAWKGDTTSLNQTRAERCRYYSANSYQKSKGLVTFTSAVSALLATAAAGNPEPFTKAELALIASGAVAGLSSSTAAVQAWAVNVVAWRYIAQPVCSVAVAQGKGVSAVPSKETRVSPLVGSSYWTHERSSGFQHACP